MEEKKEKKSFLKKWAQRIGLALGLTASTLALGTGDANANEINVDDKNNVKVTDNVEQANTSSAALSRLEQLIEQNNKLFENNNQINFNKTSNSISDLADSVSKVSKSSNLNSKINTVKTVSDSIDKANDAINNVTNKFEKTNQVLSQVLNTDKTQVKSVESEEIKTITNNKDLAHDEISQTLSTDEAIAKDIISRTHFSAIKYNPYDKEDALSDEIVSLSQQISEAKYNGNDKLAHYLTLRRDELKQQRIEITNNRLENDVQPQVLNNTYEYKSRDITPEKLDELTDFARNSSEDWTPGQKLAHYSNGLTNLNIAIEGYIKNNNPDTMSKTDRTNYYHTLSQLLQVYELVKEETTLIGKEAEKNINNPAYNLELPKYDYQRKSSTTINNEKPIVSNEPVPQVRINHSKKTVGRWEDKVPVQIYNPEYTRQQPTEKAPVTEDIEEVKITQEVQKTQTSTEAKIDESKLADVSVGQMGIFEDEEPEKPARQPGEIDESKLADVSIGQMGAWDWDKIWDDIESIVDEEIARNQTSNSKVNDNSKSKDDDDDFER